MYVYTQSFAAHANVVVPTCRTPTLCSTKQRCRKPKRVETFYPNIQIGKAMICHMYKLYIHTPKNMQSVGLIKTAIASKRQNMNHHKPSQPNHTAVGSQSLLKTWMLILLGGPPKREGCIWFPMVCHRNGPKMHSKKYKKTYSRHLVPRLAHDDFAACSCYFTTGLVSCKGLAVCNSRSLQDVAEVKSIRLDVITTQGTASQNQRPNSTQQTHYRYFVHHSICVN